MTDPWPQLRMTPQRLALEADLVEHGVTSRVDRFRMVFRSVAAEEFGLDETEIDPLLQPLVDTYLPGRDPESDGGRLGAMTNFIEKLSPLLRDLGADDDDYRNVGIWGTRLWRCAEIAAPFLYHAHEEDGKEPEEPATSNFGIGGWVA